MAITMREDRHHLQELQKMDNILDGKGTILVEKDNINMKGIMDGGKRITPMVMKANRTKTERSQPRALQVVLLQLLPSLRLQYETCNKCNDLLLMLLLSSFL